MRADLARLAGEKAEAEGRVEKERAEKHKALLEKEQFRAHVHHLARALRREHEKQATAARHQVRLIRYYHMPPLFLPSFPPSLLPCSFCVGLSAQ